MNRYYRARLSNILSTVTKEQLMIWLKIPLQFSQRIKFSDEQSLNQFMVVYVNQRCAIQRVRPAGPAGPRGDGRAGRTFSCIFASRPGYGYRSFGAIRDGYSFLKN